MGCKLGKVSWFPAVLASRFAPKPGDHPAHIHGHRCQKLLEVRARQADVATPAESEAPYTLGKGILDTRSRSAY